MASADPCDGLLSVYAAFQANLTANKCIAPAMSRNALGGCDAEEGSYSVGLHVVAIFVLLIASFIGTMLPLLGNYVPCLQLHPFVVVTGKCVSTGVVMAVALVHMMNNGVLGFMKPCVPDVLRDSFDAYSLTFAMAAAMLMHALDSQMNAVLENWISREASKPSEPSSGEVDGVCQPEEDVVVPAPEHDCAGHSHGALSSVRLDSARRVAAAIFMEFGLALHSVFLGLAVGIADDAQTRALLVALTFHQVFEGLALGSRLAEARMRMLVELAMTLIYSVSVPLGTAIGVATVKGVDVNMSGSTFNTVEAISDSVCGGILLYLGFTLLLVDFPADLNKFAGMGMRHRSWKRFGMFAALWFGTIVMTILGRWA
ncbi:cation transporter [Trypanosoma grayi]|uniref:cation transporter n=1 Tax=Trypanosoma grayi TaxID=71804 RepID=UPI0004F49525|nr:cation transporter [Trypanosoma grayi]KEG06253.1 cation transporter [Trypanosoma grayi]